MKLILIQKVTNLGGLGDIVDVKPGYGRNFLVPKGKALPATASNVAELEEKRAEYHVTVEIFDMIGKLTLVYNRSRQASITKELIEIISGAEAL